MFLCWRVRPPAEGRFLNDSPGAASAVILINQGGGSAGGDDVADKVRAALAEAGIDGEVELLDGAKCAERAAEAVAGKVPLVIAGGGDGTISAAAGAIAGSGTVLGVLPLGTLNHFARDLGIPFDIAEACKIIAAGRTQKVDVAELNGRVFINNSALGLYPLMVADREVQQKRLGRSKRLALLVASIRTLIRFRHQRLRLTVNDSQTATIDTSLLFVGNNDYGISLPAAGKRESLSDGELCVMVLRKKGRLGLAAASLRALVGLRRRDDMIRLDHVKTIKVDSRRSHLTVAVDGETVQLPAPLEYRIRPRALLVIGS
ncbi:diacylglycerol kinase family lipid kinase [Sphingomonas sinipercae]|uniref:Diacylglycerol kinase family lipid kinase n=1 Tax=Sphingomonas sinipercae TaxID=2714944 RepID=A0A6G7ZLG7_9SPHN|nr:diacylglycerol kinase family protein [Sphingomonas sinipercae]QIL01824.1 diacylglycerol kinase family lipid kinase [Sphingomonas sinipercae]